MALRELGEIGGIDVGDGSVVDDPSRDVPPLDESARPLDGVRVDFVVVRLTTCHLIPMRDDSRVSSDAINCRVRRGSCASTSIRSAIFTAS